MLLTEIYQEAELTNEVMRLLEQTDFTDPRASFAQYGHPSPINIIKAIENKNYILIYYAADGSEKNHKILNGFRIIEPYCYGTGLSTKPRQYNPKIKNRKYLRAYVLKEFSVLVKNTPKKYNSVSLTKDEPYWRMFRVGKIKSWRFLPANFVQARDGYNQYDKDLVTKIRCAKF
jgi:hypothetical protein